MISAEEYENRLKMEGKKAEAKWILEACRNRLEHSLGDDADQNSGTIPMG